jgi:uncharacterized protein YcbX
MSTEWSRVGTVAAVWRYPVKGVGGELVHESRVGWHGLSGDRRFALHRVADASGLPWASPRDFPMLVTWRASDRTAGTALRVTTHDGQEFDIGERDIDTWRRFGKHASSLLGETTDLMCLWQGAFDSMSISIVTMNTLRSAGALVDDVAVDPRRFRANLVVDCDGDQPWPESKWLGRELRFGGLGDAAVLRADRHTTRCQVVDLDPESGDLTFPLFDRLRDANRNRAGVYATTVHVGTVRTGDTVEVR